MVIHFVEVGGCEIEGGERGETWAGYYFWVGFWCGEYSGAQMECDE
jgi:hypothetical protein